MDKFVNDLFDILVKILPADWEKTILHIELAGRSHSLLFFVKAENTVKYFSFAELEKLGFFSRYEFQNVSMQIGKVSREYQQTFEKKWIGYTLVIFRNGRNFVDFEHQPNAVSDDWKRKYLI